MFSACGSSGDVALEQLRDCPTAVELLGDEIGITYGISYGSSETSGGLERADVTIPVAGDKSRGTFHYSIDGVGNSFRFAGELNVGDETVDIGRCSGEKGDTRSGSGTFDGEVISSSHPEVDTGSRCMGTMVIRESIAEMRLICPNDQNIYTGEGPVKFTGEDHDVNYHDKKTSKQDGNPTFDLVTTGTGKPDGENGTIRISDTAKDGVPGYEIVINL